MSPGELSLELLTADHRLNDFSCGNPALDHWLITHALASQRADIARTYLALEDDVVVGYLSLTTGSVRPDEAPKRHARGMPRHPIPTILIARLAVEQHHQGKHFGSRLLGEALRRAVTASDTVAARLVVVDAIDEAAAAFYRRWGFIDAPENPYGSSARLPTSADRCLSDSQGHHAWLDRRETAVSATKHDAAWTVIATSVLRHDGRERCCLGPQAVRRQVEQTLVGTASPRAKLLVPRK